MTRDELPLLADRALEDPGAWWPVFSDALQELDWMPSDDEMQTIVAWIVPNGRATDPRGWWIANVRSPTPTFARALARLLRRKDERR